MSGGFCYAGDMLFIKGFPSEGLASSFSLEGVCVYVYVCTCVCVALGKPFNLSHSFCVSICKTELIILIT